MAERVPAFSKDSWEHHIVALWLAPLVSTLPLIPFFSLPLSPWFLGRLETDASHPTAWPWVGPIISAMGVLFDGTLLGYAALLIVGLPVYLLLRRWRQLSAARIVFLGIVAAVCASKFIARHQHFQQPALREFATSWVSTLLACLSGGAAGVFVSYLVVRQPRLPDAFVVVAFFLPIMTLIAAAATIAISASIWRAP